MSYPQELVKVQFERHDKVVAEHEKVMAQKEKVIGEQAEMLTEQAKHIDELEATVKKQAETIVAMSQEENNRGGSNRNGEQLIKKEKAKK